MNEIVYPPQISCDLSQEEFIQVEVENTTRFSMEDIEIQFMLNGEILGNVEYIDSLIGDSIILFSFENAVDLSQFGAYTLSVWINHGEDDYQGNDSI